MTHHDQNMTVILNRGAPTSMSGFAADDVVRFGTSQMQSGSITIEAHSVTVIELGVVGYVAPVEGCTDESATNYDPGATEDDGSCIYPEEPMSGCTDSEATNYDEQATVDDGSCTYPDVDITGCMDSTALNYDPAATINEGCVFSSNEDDETESDNSTVEENNSSDQTSTENETTNSDSSTGNGTNRSVTEELKTCEGCCGATLEVSVDESCPTQTCSPCVESQDSDANSSTVLLTQSILLGGIVILVITLLSLRRNGREEDFIVEWDDQENRL